MNARTILSFPSAVADKYIPVKELENLDVFKGRTFLVERHKQTTAVKLVKVGRRDVQLEYVSDKREDEYSISQAEFRKFYKLAP